MHNTTKALRPRWKMLAGKEFIVDVRTQKLIPSSWASWAYSKRTLKHSNTQHWQHATILPTNASHRRNSTRIIFWNAVQHAVSTRWNSTYPTYPKHNNPNSSIWRIQNCLRSLPAGATAKQSRPHSPAFSGVLPQARSQKHNMQK